MITPRALVHALHTHWDTIEVLARLSREFPIFTTEQVRACIARSNPGLNAEQQGALLRQMVNSMLLQTVPRSDDLQLDPHVLTFVRGLTREHELGLTAVLQARVAAIRDATEALAEGIVRHDIDRVRWPASQLAELFRQIGLQLEQDRHAIQELAENARSADAHMPASQRYQRVLQAYDQYVEPMNSMMDTGPEGSFYQHLEAAERTLDQALEQFTIQGSLYSHRLQLRQVSYQAKELRRFGRIVAQQCADILLPLREEALQHNALTSAIASLLQSVRKKGLHRVLSRPARDSRLPVWRNGRGLKIQAGDEVRDIMAAARHYRPQAVAFPQDLPASETVPLPDVVDEAALRSHLAASLPVTDLLAWLKASYGHLQDATLMRLFHDLQHGDVPWQTTPASTTQQLDLHAIRVLHHPHEAVAAVPSPKNA